MTDEIDAPAGDPGPEPLLNLAQLALAFNTSENTVGKWRKRGMPVAVEGGNGVSYGFLFSQCKAWRDGEVADQAEEQRIADQFVAQKRMEFLGLDVDDKKAGLSPAQMRELAQAELVWMQAAERRKSLVQADDVAELLDTIFTETRAALDGLPDWLEREFALTGDQVERAVSYTDEVLVALKGAISASAIGAPDGLDERFAAGLDV